MKQCISIIEVLMKTVVVDTGNSDTDSLKAAIECVKEAYDAEKIVLDASNLVPDPLTGESASFSEADWIEKEEVQKMEADFTI